MTTARALAAVTAMLVLVGCYSQHDADAAGLDGGSRRRPCDPVGSMASCLPECGGSWGCRSLPVGGECRDGLCFATGYPPLQCWLPLVSDDPPPRMFSYRGDHACMPWAEVFDFVPGHFGVTVAESDCDAVEREFGRSCLWSDGTTRTRTPPSTHLSCPAEPSTTHPASILCGGSCGDCSTTEPVGGVSTACIGRNDERDLGVCALVDEGFSCNPRYTTYRICRDMTVRDRLPAEWGTANCACLSFLREDGFERAGWVVPDTNCLAYRALYPGQVECYDDDWNPLP